MHSATRSWIRTLIFLGMLVVAGCGGAPAEPASPFVRTEVKGLGDPEVVVVNAADRPITVTVSGPTSTKLEIPEGQTRSARVKPGSYRYHAEAPAARPFDGTDEFAPDGRYSWNFVVISKLPRPSAAVLGQLKSVLQTGFNDDVTFDGVRLGHAQGSLPGAFNPEGEHPTGYKVLFKGGRASAFIFRSNFTSALKLFEGRDLLGRFGEPASKLREKDSEIYIYEKLRVGFMVGKDQSVTGLMCL